jgi:hypothetical protein
MCERTAITVNPKNSGTHGYLGAQWSRSFSNLGSPSCPQIYPRSSLNKDEFFSACGIFKMSKETDVPFISLFCALEKLGMKKNLIKMHLWAGGGGAYLEFQQSRDRDRGS